MKRSLLSPLLVTTVGIMPACPVAADWRPHTVWQLNGAHGQTALPARRQILTESWRKLVRAPYLVYMPDKDKLLMLLNCGAPLNAAVVTSADRGRTWSDLRWTRTDAQGKPNSGVKHGLAYLGNGRLLFAWGTLSRWASDDYGESWYSLPAGQEELTNWDPILVDTDRDTGKVTRLAEALYRETGEVEWSALAQAGDAVYEQGFIRFCHDGGRTWGDAILVPQWRGVSEVALARAANGDMVAACRTAMPRQFRAWIGQRTGMDHYTGLAVSVSRDDGHTWSELERLYAWGRHHPSMVVMPNGDVVMSYVVRRGYVENADGFPQFGIEAVVSHDNGRTWDLDHRYILHDWPGPAKGPNFWCGGCQATSSVLLPDGWIITAYGTGYRAKFPVSGRPGHPRPWDIGIVCWRPAARTYAADRRIRDAAFDSDARNILDPAQGRPDG